jgi:hypothetical protein
MNGLYKKNQTNPHGNYGKKRCSDSRFASNVSGQFYTPLGKWNQDIDPNWKYYLSTTDNYLYTWTKKMDPILTHLVGADSNLWQNWPTLEPT